MTDFSYLDSASDATEPGAVWWLYEHIDGTIVCIKNVRRYDDLEYDALGTIPAFYDGTFITPTPLTPEQDERYVDALLDAVKAAP